MGGPNQTLVRKILNTPTKETKLSGTLEVETCSERNLNQFLKVKNYATYNLTYSSDQGKTIYQHNSFLPKKYERL